MRKLLTGTAVTLAIAGLVGLAPTKASHAQEIEPGSTPSTFGMVRSYSGNTVAIQGLDGAVQTYNVPDEVAASGIQPGQLVGFDVDEEGGLSRVEPPQVDQTLEGTVSSIDELGNITVTSEDGQTLTALVGTEAIERSGLVEGDERVRLTTYQGTSASKMCQSKCVGPCPALAPPPPVGAPELPPPIPALW